MLSLRFKKNLVLLFKSFIANLEVQLDKKYYFAPNPVSIVCTVLMTINKSNVKEKFLI